VKIKGCFPFNQLVQFEIQGIVLNGTVFSSWLEQPVPGHHITQVLQKNTKHKGNTTFFTFLTRFGGQSTAIIFFIIFFLFY